jgi:hypothetical protein
MNLQKENEDLKTALYHTMVLLAQTAEATADLLERTVGFVDKGQVGATRAKANAILQGSKTLRVQLGKLRPNLSL